MLARCAAATVGLATLTALHVLVLILVLVAVRAVLTVAILTVAITLSDITRGHLIYQLLRFYFLAHQRFKAAISSRRAVAYVFLP